MVFETYIDKPVTRIATPKNAVAQDQERPHVRQLAEGLDVIACNPGSDVPGTCKTPDGKRLDWIPTTKDLEFVDYRVLPVRVSDHVAVYTEIRMARKMH